MFPGWECAACGTPEFVIRYRVLKTYSDGEQEEIMVCENCRPKFDPVEVLFTRISGLTYSEKQRPSFWANAEPLHLDWEQAFTSPHLPLSDYPLIEDFEVMIEGIISKHKLGKEEPSSYFVWLFSPSRGYLTHILSADELKDLCHPDFALPHGDFDHPYYDVDQGWKIVLAEDGEFVYILAGGWDHKSFDLYDTWFKVEKKRYYHQWEQAIQLAAHCQLHKRNRQRGENYGTPYYGLLPDPA